jgi:hypothetical protein
MGQQGNDEAARRTPPEPPAHGAPEPPAYGAPEPPAYGAPEPPAYGSPPEPGTAPYDAVPPTAPYQAPPGQGYPGQGYPAQGYPGQWPAYPEASQGVLALVLGIIGLFVFWPVAPVAWVVGRNDVRGVDAGRRDPANRGVALAGQIMGIIGTVLLVLAVAFAVVAVILLVSVGTSSGGLDGGY